MTWRVKGSKSIDEQTSEAFGEVHLSEINERLGLHLPDEEHFDTIAGFELDQSGRIPRVGEEMTYDGVKIKVPEVRGGGFIGWRLKFCWCRSTEEASSELGARSAE